MMYCLCCGDLSDKDVCNKCIEANYVKCPVCNQYHVSEWVLEDTELICEDCHLTMLGFEGYEQYSREC